MDEYEIRIIFFDIHMSFPKIRLKTVMTRHERRNRCYFDFNNSVATRHIHVPTYHVQILFILTDIIRRIHCVRVKLDLCKFPSVLGQKL